MLPNLIIPFWIFLFLFLIYKWKFFNVIGITKQVLIAAFLFRIILGCSNYYIWQNVIGHGDSLRYFNDSKLLYEILPEHPGDFLRLVFGYYKTSLPEDLHHYISAGSIAPSAPEYHMVRINALLNIFSFGGPYGNIIILSFLYFIGLVTLMKSLVKFNLITTFTKIQQAIIFFLPSLVFWSSGLLKEGPTLLLICIIIVQCLHLEKQFEFKRILLVCLSLFFLLLIRDYLLALIIPNLFIWYFAKRTPQTAYRVFIVCTVSALTILFAAAWLQPQLNIVLWLKSEQNYFLVAPDDPDYQFKALNGQVWDMITKIPYALNNILFRPNIFNSNDVFRIYQSIELIFIWIFLIYAIQKRKHPFKLSPTLLFILYFSIELLIAYGMITFDADTLSRYRSIPLFLVILVAIIALDGQKPTKKDIKTT